MLIKESKGTSSHMTGSYLSIPPTFKFSQISKTVPLYYTGISLTIAEVSNNVLKGTVPDNLNMYIIHSTPHIYCYGVSCIISSFFAKLIPLMFYNELQKKTIQ